MKKRVSSDYVKKETTLVAVLIALVVGFLGGMIFNIYNSGGGSETFQPAADTKGNAALLAELKREASEQPQNAEAWIQLGNGYFDTDQFSEAINAYEKALEITPDNADVRTDLGIMYRRSGNPERAIEEFDRAFQIDPSHEIALFDKGIVLMHDLKDREGAIQAWEKLLEINPFAKAPDGQPMMELVAKLKKEGTLE